MVFWRFCSTWFQIYCFLFRWYRWTSSGKVLRGVQLWFWQHWPGALQRPVCLWWLVSKMIDLPVGLGYEPQRSPFNIQFSQDEMSILQFWRKEWDVCVCHEKRLLLSYTRKTRMIFLMNLFLHKHFYIFTPSLPGTTWILLQRRWSTHTSKLT